MSGCLHFARDEVDGTGAMRKVQMTSDSSSIDVGASPNIARATAWMSGFCKFAIIVVRTEGSASSARISSKIASSSDLQAITMIQIAHNMRYVIRKMQKILFKQVKYMHQFLLIFMFFCR